MNAIRRVQDDIKRRKNVQPCQNQPLIQSPQQLQKQPGTSVNYHMPQQRLATNYHWPTNSPVCDTSPLSVESNFGSEISEILDIAAGNSQC